MPVFWSEDKKIINKLVAGSYDQYKGSFHPQNEVLIIWSSGTEPGQVSLQIPADYNAMLYLIRGSAKINGFGNIESEHLAVLSNSGDTLELETLEDGTQFILLSGLPIGEPVTQQGPFVMNTSTEVLEAMRDYQMGKIGILIED